MHFTDAAYEAAVNPDSKLWAACVEIFNSDIWEKKGRPVFPGMIAMRYVDPCMRAFKLMSDDKLKELDVFVNPECRM